MTNWGSRLGISRIVESFFMSNRAMDDRVRPLSVAERLGASVIGGTLACWNQPIEVIRVKVLANEDSLISNVFSCRCNHKLRTLQGQLK